jgi:septum formation topological specificity factor MinE
MTREEAIEFIAQSVKSDVDMAKVADAIKALEQEPVLDKIRTEISEYGSIWVEYKITGRSDKDIEQLVTNVLKQVKKQVLDVIDKYRAEIKE